MATQILTVLGAGTYTPVGWGAEGGDHTRLQSDDGDASRLYTPTANDARTVTHTPLDITGTINSLTVNAKVKNLNPIDSTQRILLRIGGTNYFSINIVNNGTAYVTISNTWSTNPATGNAWTQAEINNTEIGLQKQDGIGTAWTYMFAEVDYSAVVTPPPVEPTGPVRQTKTGNTASAYQNSSTIAFNSPVLANSALMLVVATTAGNADDISGVTDSLGNTWVKAVSRFANGRNGDIWYVANTIAGTPTITISSTSYTEKSFGVSEITGLPNPLTIDGVGFTDDVGYVNSHTLTIPTTGTNDVIIGGYAGSSGLAVYTGENVITAGGDTVNAGMVIDLEGTNTITLGSDQYESGVFVGVAFLTGAPTPPVDPTPLAVTTKSWHPFGFKPNKTITELQQIAREKYDAWFAYTLSSTGMPAGLTNALRIRVPDQGFYNNPDFNGTVSEGQGYGMLMKAWFSNPDLPAGIHDPNARAEFDKLFKYYNHYKNARGLMHWNITYQGVIADQNGATDGDLDAAMALVVMSRLWSSDGAVNYTAEATKLINAIRDHEFVPATGVPGTGLYPNIITNGDGWGFATNNIMPDYFRPGFMREFYYHTNDSRWLDIVNANYEYALRYYYDNYQGGLVPDRQTREHTSLGAETDQVTYNSVRLGFGVMYDYLWNGYNAPTLGLDMMNKMAYKAKENFITGGNIKAPNYNLDFTTWQEYSNLAGYGLVGPASLGMSTYQEFSTQIIDAMNATPEFSASYFNGGVGLMGLLAMTGLGQNYRVSNEINTSGYMKVWNGSEYVHKPIKVWNGSAWVIKPLKRYNSNSWENTK